MRPTAIGLAPNTFSQDIKLVAGLLFKPWQWQRSGDGGDQKEYPVNWFLFDSGRSALFLLLKTFGIGQSDEVLLQAFTCVAVPNPIIWAGATPVYVDIDRQTLNIDIEDLQKKVTAYTKAIIVQHTFGLPAPMNEILAVAKKHNLVVIEDCAHAQGAKYQGQEVGTLGDAAFFSFGRDKVISSVAGGAATLRSGFKVRGSRLRKRYGDLSYPPRLWTLQQLLHPLLSGVVLDTYGIGLGKLLHFFFLRTGIMAKANSENEKKFAQKPSHIPSKMPNALQYLMRAQLKRLDQFNKRRNEIALRYLAANLKPAQPQTAGRIWLRFPMLVNDPRALHAHAKEQGIFLGDWYDQVVAPKGVNLEAVSYKMGMCPVAEEVSKYIINLPVYPKMVEGEVEKVIELVKNF